MGERSPALNYRKKNRFKAVKTTIQLAILVFIGIVLFQTLVNVEKYAEPDKSKWTNDKGFIALSYFGVSRSGTPKLIAKAQLNKQLKVLKEMGYVTISQQDILDYYEKGKKLPDKALFLAFEDGRNDSELFAQPLLEKYNFKATFLSYANKMGNGDGKFLQPGDMKKMMKNGYWELGSNGYRLTYINIFDSEGRFVGLKDENELRNKMKIDYYNHYLMDFLRDKDMIPSEDRPQMEKRITDDYVLMEQIYTDKLGFVPNTYMIMHANALGSDMNRLVTDVNDANIRRVFKMHFNREGDALNGKEHDVYDLSRVQPAPYWYTNHLLMKIKEDTGKEALFLTGEKKRAADWETARGAAEFIGNRIALTSEPSGTGMLVLKKSDDYRDVKVIADLAGNVVGRQTIYARYDRGKDSFVRISLDNNVLSVEQKKAGQPVEKLVVSILDDIDWKETDLALNKATIYTQAQTSKIDLTEESQYPVNIADTRKLDIVLQGTKLHVAIDGGSFEIARDIDASIDSGAVAIESAWNAQNKRDNIYDGVFDDLKISALKGNGKAGDVLYSNRLTGFQKLYNEAMRSFDATVDWMIETF
ncbi:polysaccharide deacetylase family protein [Cohnella terricola]|uniref:Polysaccharide deacetylase family protein n=1 Tax=Cohnella terricola TaxID=1289167 RepID=A0A559JX97_9BACL|nr:polysaccharide deacetylase family protein [Cohnella terricola]TVY04512.1 polysaccharide deacetylase family protein [Cohnella terricola]